MIADRVDRRKLLITTQTVMMLLAFILGGLALTHVVKPWHILVLAFLLGITNAFDAPARHAFVLDMVNKEHLTNAISLNSTMFNIAITAGPAVSGIAYALFGAGWCFVLNGISFLAIISGLFLMRFEPRRIKASADSIRSQLKEGLEYIRSNKNLIVLFLQLGITNLFGLAFTYLIPAWAVNVLHGDAVTNGILQSARGLGALIMAISIASLGNVKSKGKVVTTSTFIFSMLLLIFSFINHIPASALVILLLGAMNISISMLINVLVQTNTSDAMRGRVMSIYSFMFMGITPIGSLWMGFAAGQIGVQNAMIMTAALVFASTLAIFILMPRLREME